MKDDGNGSHVGFLISADLRHGTFWGGEGLKNEMGTNER
jgi:hypothetical protein